MIPVIKDTALGEVAVNVSPLKDDTDFKTIETAIAYNESGMTLQWNQLRSDGSVWTFSVTPTTSGDYDWTHQGNGMYSVEIPASGGASANNDVCCLAWFTGKCDGVLPWVGPPYFISSANVVNALLNGTDRLEVDVQETAAALTFNLTGNITGNLSGSVGSVTGAVGSVTGNVGGNVVGSVASVVGNVGGNVVGSVGSISGITFPTNFDVLVIGSDGFVELGRQTIGKLRAQGKQE
jgi:hypothetical protein